MSTKEMDMDAQPESSKSSAASTVNEEGDARAVKPPPPAQPVEEVPLSKQRLGAYKHFARTANRTLTTFTNEMSEILRQSIERLDSISMKVRGCVYDIERQRVAMPMLPGIGEASENTPGVGQAPGLGVGLGLGLGLGLGVNAGLGVGAGGVEDIWERGDDGKKSLISDIKEIAVKCKKTPSAERIPVEQFRLLSDNKPHGRLDVQIVPVEVPPVPAPVPLLPVIAPMPVPVIAVDETLQLEALKQKISNRNTPTTSRRNTSQEPTSSSNMDEKEVMQRIKKQYKRNKRKNADGDAPAKQSEAPEAAATALKKPERKRKPRKRDTTTTVTTSAKRPRHLKKPSEHKETLSATSPGKSVKSNQSMRLAIPKDGASPSGVRMELKNTKLARKFASSNFHDAIKDPARVESYTGGRIVKLTSDSRQDWSVIMHTQKSPTRYELRQSAPFPANNILDEITLKDLEPLKAEYPRRDNLHGCNQRLEDSLLYKLVNGTAESMECLINVSSSARRTESVQATGGAQPAARKRFISQVTPTFALPSGGAPPLQVTHLSTRAGTPTVTKSAIVGIKTKNVDSRAGIYRSQEQRPAAKRPLNVKESVVEQSKRIALKLSEMKTAKYTAPLQENHQIYKPGKKDAKRRLKQYLADPAKTHQKYMVMMLHSVTYDNHLQLQHLQHLQHSDERSVADVLAKYIYLDTDWKWTREQEYTVSVMTTSTPSPPQSSNVKRSYMEPVVVTPTKERDGTRSPGRSARGGESSWKNIVRSCYMQPSTQAQAQAALAGNKSIDPSQVRGIISNMELQLKQVIENPKIENKEVVIKGLQEQMEWILCTLEGQTFALKKRKDENASKKTRRVDKSILPRKGERPERREPILKPMDTKSKQVINVRMPEVPPLVPLQESPSLGGQLRKAPATTTIPSSSASASTSEISPITVEMQTKLLTKWRTLEHPSGESMEIESLKDLSLPSAQGQDDSAFQFLDAKKAKSRPETRREGRLLAFAAAGTSASARKSSSTFASHGSFGSHLSHASHASHASHTSHTSHGSHGSQERYQSQHEGSLTRDGKRSSTNTEKILDQILAKIELDEDVELEEQEQQEHQHGHGQELEEEQEQEQEPEEETELLLVDEEDEQGSQESCRGQTETEGDTEACDKDRESIYDTCRDVDDPQQIHSQGQRHGQLTAEEITQYQQSIKVLETQLGEETQRFVDEMDEVIKQIESKTLVVGAAGTVAEDLTLARVGYTSHAASSATSMASDIVRVVTVVESMQFQPIHMDVELEPELPERDTPSAPPDDSSAAPNAQPIIGQLTPKEISRALHEDMRRHFSDATGDAKDETKKADKRRDYDLLEPKPQESPMIQDIRRSLFQMHALTPKEPRLGQVSAQPAQGSQAMQQQQLNGKGDSPSSRNFNRMPWETSDKSTSTTTVSLTNLDDYARAPSSELELGGAVNSVQARQSKSEITIKIDSSECSSVRLSRTVQLVESALGARMTRFFEESGLSELSRSVESILSSTLAATLANQERISSISISDGALAEKQHFEGLLTFVYSCVFTILCLGLNWCPACIA